VRGCAIQHHRTESHGFRGARAVTQEKAAAEAEEKLRQDEEMQVQRKLDSKELAGETIRRELAESQILPLGFWERLTARRGGDGSSA